jgi:chromosome partitioning protein
VGEVIACANQKGGVGKTTTVVSLGAYLASDGYRVLIVDLDPQGNATSGLGVEKTRLEASVYDVLLADASPEDVMLAASIENLSLMPSDRSLAGAEVELVPISGRERRLSQVLSTVVGDFDYVLLDCPPSLGLLTVNALTGQLMATIDLVRDHLNPRLVLKGVLLTMHDGRTSLSADVTAEVRNHLGDRVFEAVVPRSVRLAEAPSYGRPIATYSAASRGALAYQAVAYELLTRSGRQPSAALGEARGRYLAPRPA